MKIVIPGGSGQVGTLLARQFHKDGHEVVVLSRSPQSSPWRSIRWDGAHIGDWCDEVDGADVIINLAGRSVNCRYTAKNQREILDSRVNSTHVVGEAIGQAKNPPHTWLQASTATIYAHRFDRPNGEANGIIGGSEPNVPAKWRFSTDVAKAWEQTIDETITPHTRMIKMRSAMVMSPDRGGVFDTFLQLVRFGLGGRAASGKQFVSWVYELDFVRSVYWLIKHEAIEGVVNIASPNPLPNTQFMRHIRQAWGIPIGLPATKWMLEIGTRLMVTESELILKSRRVIPSRLTEAGFDFEFPDWREAAIELVQRWHSGQ